MSVEVNIDTSKRRKVFFVNKNLLVMTFDFEHKKVEANVRNSTLSLVLSLCQIFVTKI